MVICKNFLRILFSLLIVTLFIQGVIPTKCLWEILYDVGLMLTANPPSSRATDDPLFDVWGETEVCYPDDTREQHQKNFGPTSKVSKYTDDSEKKAQFTNRVEISTNMEKPRVAIGVKAPHGTQVTVKHKANITLKAAEQPLPPAAPVEGITYNYYSGLSSQTVILICFLALVITIAICLSFCLYQEKKQKKVAENSNSVQSIVTATSVEAEETDTEINEILLDDISNLTSTMMVRTYLESLATELKSTHSKENIRKYITDEFLTMVSERIAQDAYMRMNFMESITPDSLMRLAHLYNLTGMRQRQNMSNFLGLPQEKNINVCLKFGKGFEVKTKVDSQGSPKDDSTQTEVKQEALEDGVVATTQTEEAAPGPSTSSSSSSSSSSSGTSSSSSTTSSSGTSSSTSSSSPSASTSEAKDNAVPKE